MSVKTYLEKAKRGKFQWQCIEITDGIGMGGVLREEVYLHGRSASIYRESHNEFLVEVEVRNEPYIYEEYRSTRKYARILAERLITEDIEKESNTNNKI